MAKHEIINEVCDRCGETFESRKDEVGVAEDSAISRTTEVLVRTKNDSDTIVEKDFCDKCLDKFNNMIQKFLQGTEFTEQHPTVKCSAGAMSKDERKSLLNNWDEKEKGSKNGKEGKSKKKV